MEQLFRCPFEMNTLSDIIFNGNLISKTVLNIDQNVWQGSVHINISLKSCFPENSQYPHPWFLQVMLPLYSFSLPNIKRLLFVSGKAPLLLKCKVLTRRTSQQLFGSPAIVIDIHLSYDRISLITFCVHSVVNMGKVLCISSVPGVRHDIFNLT